MKRINIFIVIITLFFASSNFAKGEDVENLKVDKRKIQKPKYIKCINAEVTCPSFKSPTCATTGYEPVCIGNTIACCTNKRGGLTCKEYGQKVSTWDKNKIKCEEKEDENSVADIVLGDFNNDKSKDIAYRLSGTSEWFVSTVPEFSGNFENDYYGRWSNNVNWENVVAGDFDGDGNIDDIAGRVKATGQWWVSISDGEKFENKKFGVWPKEFKWVDILVGDFDEDGLLDDIAGRDEGSSTWFVAISDGEKFENKIFAKWSPKDNYEHVNIGDFDGDGVIDDIVALNKTTSKWLVSISDGKKFDQKIYGKIENKNISNIQVGDFNGDEITDIIARDSTKGNWIVFESDEGSFNTKSYGTWESKYNWRDIVVGKFNDDEYHDVLGTLKSSKFGWLLVGESNGEELKNKFYSGPTVNLDEAPIFDDYGKWPPHVELVDIKAADFNGDGIDELAGRVPNSEKWVYLIIEDKRSSVIAGDDGIH